MSRRAIFDLRLRARGGRGDEAVSDVHRALARWSGDPGQALIAEPYRILLDTPVEHLDRLLAQLVDELLPAARQAGADVAAGVAVGPGRPLLLADGRRAHAGSVVEDASRAADLARFDSLLLTGGARTETTAPWRFGDRLLAPAESVQPELSLYPLLWHDHQVKPAGQPHPRRRGTVMRFADDAALILGDDDRMYRALTGEQLVEVLPTGAQVWFVADERGADTAPRAFATSPLGARLIGTVERRGDHTLLRSHTKSGHWMTFRARDNDMLAETAHVGDWRSFTVTPGPDGPGADDIRTIEGHWPTVLERLLIACMDELTSNEASGAAAAVRRNTKTLTTDAEPSCERLRLWRVLEHARTKWAVPALRLARHEYLAKGLLAIEAVHDAESAEGLSITLRDYLKHGPVVTDRMRGDVTPVLTAVRLAAHYGSKVDPLRDDPLEVDHMARAATSAGQAMAQALLCGVITAIPAEAKTLGRELASIGAAGYMERGSGASAHAAGPDVARLSYDRTPSDDRTPYRRSMSVSTAESELKRAQKALEDARRRQAAEEKKAADADKAAASKEQSARRTSSASTAAGHKRSAQSKRDEAQKARAKAADFSAKAATAQTNMHKAQDKLDKARAADNKKREDREAKERSTRAVDEKRQRQQGDRESRRAAREHDAAERARRAADAERDQQVAALELELAEARAMLDSRPWENVPEKITVLFLTADPDGVEPLHIGREIRQIQEQVRSSKLRDSIAFEYRHAVRVTDLFQHLNEVQPDVAHFSGHGADAGLALHDADDSVRLLTNAELADVLDAAPKPLKLAVFNSCNSAEQARLAVEHVDAAVGMEQTIEDESARVFAGQLYNSLGFGFSLGLAFKQARQQVALTFGAISGDPTLVVADGLDADELVIVSPHPPSPAPERAANVTRVLGAEEVRDVRLPPQDPQ